MKVFFFGVLVLQLFFLPGSLFCLQLKLFDEIGINEESISLAKLGLLQRDDGDIALETLSALPILDIPKTPVFLTAQEIERVLKTRYGITARVIGAGIRLYPLYTIILDQEIAEKIKVELHRLYPTFPQKFVDVMLMRSPKLQKVPAGNLSYKIRIPGGRADLQKYVRLQVSDGQKELINTSFPIRLVFHLPTWKSKKFLRTGSILKRQDFYLQMSSQLQEPKNFLKRIQFPSGKKLRKNLRAGQILYWN